MARRHRCASPLRRVISTNSASRLCQGQTGQDIQFTSTSTGTVGCGLGLRRRREDPDAAATTVSPGRYLVKLTASGGRVKPPDHQHHRSGGERLRPVTGSALGWRAVADQRLLCLQPLRDHAAAHGYYLKRGLPPDARRRSCSRWRRAFPLFVADALKASSGSTRQRLPLLHLGGHVGAGDHRHQQHQARRHHVR
jgi:hypothetical protein